MQHKVFNLLPIFLLACLPVFGQNYIDPTALGYYNDALRFSRTTFGGSSRYLGISGAQTALGGDIGSIAGNPAGLGFYRRSEFSITPSLNFASTSSTYNADPYNRGYSYDGSTVRDSKANFNFHNIGVVFSGAKDDITRGAWRGGSWGIGLTKVNNFNNRYSFSGINRYEFTDPQQNIIKPNSIVDYFARQARDLNPQDYNTGRLPIDIDLAYAVYLIDADFNNRFVAFPVPEPYSDGSPRPEFVYPYDLRQSGTIETRGTHNQIDVAYGGNFNDRLYLGAAVGINTLRYNESRFYSEENINAPGQPASSFKSLSISDEVATSGTGINLRAGAIFRLTDVIRLGGSIQTPTYYAVSENYSIAMTASYNNFEYSNDPNNAILRDVSASTRDQMVFNYRMSTPLKATAGIALFAGKLGFWSTDVEYISYNSIRLSSDDASLNGDNKTINSLYKPTLNVRSGAEFRTGIFRLRAGGGYHGDPYKRDADKLKRDIIYVSGGAGIRLEDYYFDVAVVNSRTRSAFSPYTLPDEGAHPTAQIKNNFTNVSFTLGTFF